ncbi:MAG: transcriptional repressor [Tannerella sp.]|jgi:Fur family ferric uptake transcriptional regulator|nr:transcriptional repressor [Tannerella sp.]
MDAHYEQQLIKRNIRPTAMRLLILKAISGKNDALTLAGLETALETVDRSTIFRTLTLFQQSRLLHTVDDGSGSLKYALCDDACECRPEQQHVHFYCIRCGQTFCLRDVAIPLISAPKNFSIESINYVMKGVCASCRNIATGLH